LAQIDEVSSIIEYESFAELCRSSSDLLKTYDVDRVGDRGNRGDNVDDRGDDSSSDRLLNLYRTIQDRSDYLSKERLLEYAEMIDCYISYEWGIDKLHRNTVDRVKKINQYLRSKGLYTNIDEGHDFTTNTLKKYELVHRVGSSSPSSTTSSSTSSHDGNDYMILQPHDMTKQRITYAQCILICVTSSYLQKLRLKTKEKHPIQFEFDYFMSTKEDRMVILLNMEDESLSADRLLSMLPVYVHERYPTFHEKRLFNMVHMETHPQQLDDVYECILSFIVPVRQGGPYRRERVYHR
jgi:GTPase SAR1 family protein